MIRKFFLLMILIGFTTGGFAATDDTMQFSLDKIELLKKESQTTGYQVGPDDILEIVVIRPEALQVVETVAPDGTIAFPYIGRVSLKGMTLTDVQKTIEEKLSDGYMKYPVVTVSLKESRSKKFFVYGEVNRPGGYPLDEKTTVLKAISMAGGFTKFGSSSRVKVLRLKKEGPGYEILRINIKEVMSGDSSADILINNGDTIVVSEGVF